MRVRVVRRRRWVEPVSLPVRERATLWKQQFPSPVLDSAWREPGCNILEAAVTRTGHIPILILTTQGLRS